MSTPRIRPDLNATPTEEQGVKYFDVSDPKSGARMRLYDFEWLIAERMDGRRPYDEVASWARERLGIAPSPSDLENFAAKLRELGFFELDGEPQRGTTDTRTNGAQKNAAEEFDSVPSLVAESPLAGSDADSEPDAPDAHDEPEPSPPVRAADAGRRLGGRRAGVVAKDAEPKALPPAPQVNSPRVQEEITTGAVARAEPKAAKSSAGSLLILVLLLLIVAAIVAYIKFMGGSTAKVATVVATPREVVRLYDASATVRKSEGQTLSFGEAGKVIGRRGRGHRGQGWHAAGDAGVVRQDREGARRRQRSRVLLREAAGDGQGQGRRRRDVGRRGQGRREEEADERPRGACREGPFGGAGRGHGRAGFGAGGQRGQAGRSGAQAGRQARHRRLQAGRGRGGTLRAGATASLQPALGGAPLSGRIAKVDGDTVTVELPEESSVKAGDSVRLVKQRVPNVVPVPATALTHREVGDVVYILADGALHERQVSVVDRSKDEALISSGLSGGDVVVAAGADNLHDGQKATQ